MAMLVSLENARNHLRIDTTDGDADLLLKVKAASRAVLNYISNGADTFTDSTGEPYEDSNGVALDVPEDVQSATLFLIGYLDRQRDSDADKEFERGYLPAPVCALLTFYRDPSLA